MNKQTEKILFREIKRTLILARLYVHYPIPSTPLLATGISNPAQQSQWFFFSLPKLGFLIKTFHKTRELVAAFACPLGL